MRKVLLIGVLLLVGCTGQSEVTPSIEEPSTAIATKVEVEDESADNVLDTYYALGNEGTDDFIELIAVNDNTWIHRTYEQFGDVWFPANGLLIGTDEGYVMVDTPWNEAQTKSVIEMVRLHLDQEIVAAIVTHAHEDTMGGIDVLMASGIEIHSSKRTMIMAESAGMTAPNGELGADINKMVIGDKTIEIFYPGPGHTEDNVVVWVEDEQVLFGGCLVKSMDAQGLGNTDDANLKQWQVSLERLQASYPTAKVIIPGHGEQGDRSMLEANVELMKTKIPFETAGILTFLGRGSVRIEIIDGPVIYIDPYAGIAEDYALPADLVLVTHQHSDHNRVDLVTMKEDGEVYEVPSDVRPDTNFVAKGINIYVTNAYNDNHSRQTCGGFILDIDGLVLYHSGDTSKIEEMSTYSRYNIDYALICGDGYYNMGPEEASKVAELLKPRVLIPIHTSKDQAYDTANANRYKYHHLNIIKPRESIELKRLQKLD